MLVAGRGSKDSQLCNAFCLRAPARISDRRLDRESFETTIFSAEEKNHGTGATRIFGHLFWRKRRLRAAILVSPCADGFAEIHNGEELRRSSRHALASRNTPCAAQGPAVSTRAPNQDSERPGQSSCQHRWP